jgi:hypothetical protein
MDPKVPVDRNDSINYVSNGSGFPTNTVEFKKMFATDIQKHIDDGKTPDEAYKSVLNEKNAIYLGPAKKSFYDIFKKDDTNDNPNP